LVGFIESSGKSMLVNSIIGQKILPTGIYDTAYGTAHVGSANILNLPKENFYEHVNIFR
jgi:hypothetical protein